MKKRSLFNLLMTLSLITWVACEEKEVIKSPSQIQPPVSANTPEQLFPKERGEVIKLEGECSICSYELIHGKMVLEGDIMLTEAQLDQSRKINGRTQGAGLTALARRWPNNRVFFTINPALPDQERVLSAIRHWQANTNVVFIPRTTQPNFIEFLPGGGCGSNLGMIGGRQEIVLAPGCDAGAVVHEIAHAIGIFHEQSRTDRDNSVIIHWNHIQQGLEFQFQRYVDTGLAGFDNAAFDFNSIMLYDSWAFSNGIGPTITRRDFSTYSTNRTVLSSGDKDIINVMHPRSGLQLYDLKSFSDQSIALDYDGDGDDDLIFYRPGSRIFYLFQNTADPLTRFVPVISSSTGFLDYDLNSVNDRIETFDYNNDGFEDILLYRPGSRLAYLMRSNGNGTFTKVFGSASGFSSYDLSSTNDKIVALDYNNDGRVDIACYRPGSRIFYLFQSNGDGNFTRRIASGSGIGGYDLNSSVDQIISLDYDGDGFEDLGCYRPGSRIFYLLRSLGNATFSRVLASGSGIGSYDLSSTADRLVKLDVNNDGRDDVACYRPGQRIFYLLRSEGNTSFTTLISSGSGVMQYDFNEPSDKAIALDYNRDGSADLLCYRPGFGTIYFGRSTGADFVREY